MKTFDAAPDEDDPPAAPAKRAKPAGARKRPKVQPRLLRPADLAELLGVGRRTVDRMVARGEIGPRRLVLHERVIAWDRVEIEAWLGQRTDAGGLHDEASWARVRDQAMAQPSPTAIPAAPEPAKPAKRRRPGKGR